MLLLPVEVVKGRAQERTGGPFERRDDFVVVVEAGGVFDRDDGFGAEDDCQGGPEAVAVWLAQSFAKWLQYPAGFEPRPAA